MSPEYHFLCKRIAILRRNLLPPLNPTGAYTDAEYDRTRAFVALTHAEIESFIESRCNYVAKFAKLDWLQRRSVNAVIFSLHSICYSGWSALEGEFNDLPKLSTKVDVDSRVVSSIDQYKHVIGSNHGIKEKYLKKMLVPLSIRISDLDPAWVLEMTNFGGLRGQIAHMSGRANSPPDPAATDVLIREVLLPGLNKLDRILGNLFAGNDSLHNRNSWWERLVFSLRMMRGGGG